MRILALDIGERRIGVAISDPTGTVARPLCTVECGDTEDDLDAIAQLVVEQEAELVLIGQPLTLRGEIGPQAELVAKYTDRLAQVLPVPTCMWDERYSTLAAEDILRETRGKGKQRKQQEIDAIAAAVILQTYLDSHAAPEPHDPELLSGL